MRTSTLIAVAAFVLLAGCTTELSPQDRAMLTDTRNMAMQARDQAARSAQEAAASAAAAQAASEKADRIFRQSQKK